LLRNPAVDQEELLKSVGPILRKNFSIIETQRGIEKLRRRIADIDNLLSRYMNLIINSENPPELNALSVSIERTIANVFGENTGDFNRFKGASDLKASFSIYTKNYPMAIHIGSSIKNNLISSRLLLLEAIKALEEEMADVDHLGANGPIHEPEALSVLAIPKVFIVHGHDESVRETVARFLGQIGVEPVILHEQPNKGRTIITKFSEEAAGVAFAIVLISPDDMGGKKGADARPRARQNVVFELGFFIGALGPHRVAALVKGDVEKPSDFDGVVYISLDRGHWKIDLAKELKAAGFEIDLNKVI
jgi:predicted nucleotide-binding protein